MIKLPADAKKIIIQETITNMIVNAVLATIITWLVFRGKQDVPLIGGPESGAFGIVPGTFLFTAAITIALSLIMRRRISRGNVALLPMGSMPVIRRFLPEHILLRGLALGAAIWVVLVPLTLTLLSTMLADRVSFSTLLIFYIVYFVILAAIIVPVIVLRSLLPTSIAVD